MRPRERRQRRRMGPSPRSRAFFLAAALLALLVDATSESAQMRRPVEETPVRVWPEPPDAPRVRYLSALRHNLDVEPPRKRTLLQRLAGAPDPNIPRVIRKPAGVATDSRGRVLVADADGGRIFVFDVAGRRVTYLGVERRAPLTTPVDVAVDGGDRIFVADAGRKSVVVYESGGGLLKAISDPERLVNPAGLALDEARGRLYVVDSQGHRVTVVDLESLSVVESFGERGDGPGQFNFPVGIAVDREGRIYVSDTGSCSVQVFDPSYEPVERFGGRGIAPSQFTRPKQIAVDGEGHVYVVDAAFNNFQVFSRERRLLLYVGEFGEGPGEFNLPFGIHIDERDRIYVSDQVNRRVQIFQFLGGD